MSEIETKTKQELCESLGKFLLLRVDERMFNSEQPELSAKDAIICEFLIEELLKYVANYHKQGK